MSNELPNMPASPEQAPLPEADASHRQLVLVKNGQRYVFRYTLGDEAELLESLIELARDPESDLTWFDAAVLSHQMGRRLSQKLDKIIKL